MRAKLLKLALVTRLLLPTYQQLRRDRVELKDNTNGSQQRTTTHRRGTGGTEP
jgi:hypothetical protein